MTNSGADWLATGRWTASDLPVGTHYWRAKASDGVVESAWSPWYSFTVANRPPEPLTPAQMTPSGGGIITDLQPRLSVAGGATDADGDAVQYWYRVSAGGQVASSGWTSAKQWQVPAGVLTDGAAYTWTVITRDGYRSPTGPTEVTNPVAAFQVNQRIGLAGPAPLDQHGPVSVNLFNGNVHLTASSPQLATVGGPVGVSLTYNSLAAQRTGLIGRYYDGTDGPDRTVAAGEVPQLVRLDPQVEFDWGLGSPVPGAVGVDSFRVRWTGYLKVPASGKYSFGALKDDGLRIAIAGNRVYDHWSYAANAPLLGSEVTLSAGVAVPIVVEYWEDGSGASAKIRVKGPSGARWSRRSGARPVPSPRSRSVRGSPDPVPPSSAPFRSTFAR